MTEKCDKCEARKALVRLTTQNPRRCFDCLANDPSLPPGYKYKQAIERKTP